MQNSSNKRWIYSLFSFLSIFTLSLGCSSAPRSPSTGQEGGQVSSEPSSREVSKNTAPPVIVNPRVEPKIVTLTRDFSVDRPLDIYAEVKDLGSSLDEVKFALTFAPDTEQNLRFFNQPVVVDMKHLNGSTWKAHLSDDDIRKLAISGQSLKYEGHVVAKNDDGQETISADPVLITVQAATSVAGTS